MKILFVLEYYYPHIGGVEKLFQTLAEALAKRGHYITVATTLHDQSLPGTEVINGVNVVRIKARTGFGFTLFSIPKVWRLLHHHDIIHTTSYNAAVPAMVTGWLRSKKVLITFHEVWGRLWLKLPFLTNLQRRLYFNYEQLVLQFNYHKVIAVSHFTAKRLARHGIRQERIAVIYNGIQYKEFEGRRHCPPDQPVFTYFGGLGVSKGLDLIIPAFTRIRQEHPEAMLRLITPKHPAPLWKKLHQLIQYHRLDKGIEYLHELSRDELYDRVCHSTCVLIPSYSEGFCFTAAESIAMNVPVITSGRTALKEVVSGPYIEMERMNAESLYKAMQQALRNEWKETPPRYFPLEATIEQYLDLYLRS